MTTKLPPLTAEANARAKLSFPEVEELYNNLSVCFTSDIATNEVKTISAPTFLLLRLLGDTNYAKRPELYAAATFVANYAVLRDRKDLAIVLPCSAAWMNYLLDNLATALNTGVFLSNGEIKFPLKDYVRWFTNPDNFIVKELNLRKKALFG